MKSCPFDFFQACSLNVNTLTLHELITSEADGFHSKGVMFLHSPVMGELENSMQHTCTHTAFIQYMCKDAHTHLSIEALPELSIIDVFNALEGTLSKKKSL